jgi:enoyl-CoA hydratase
VRDAPVVVTSREGAVGIVELARPDKFNCLSIAVHEALDAALDEFEAEGSGVRVILLRAQGKHFCTGADLDEVKSLLPDAARVSRLIAKGNAVMTRMEASALPVVAACQGLVLAGGSELMLACDVVFAASDLRVGDQHAQYGLVPGWGGSQRFARIVGLRRALDMFYSARWIDAPTALQWGLVNYVVEPDRLNAAALEYCAKLAGRSRVGIATMKRLARQGLDTTLAHGLALETSVVVDVLVGADVREGLAAFEARRAPMFKS